MDIKSLRRKLDKGLGSVKESLAQIDIDGVKKQLGDSINSAKGSLTPTIDIAEIRKSVMEGLEEMKANAEERLDTAHEGLADAMTNVQATATNISAGMADFGSKVIANITDFAEYFSESDLWKKLSGFATKAGAQLVFIVLCLFFAIDRMPLKGKVMVMGALGYFIFPTDAIPDVIPGAGFADDFTALVTIFKTLKDSIDPASVGKAQDKLGEWFPNMDKAELSDVAAAIDGGDVDKALGMIKDTKEKGVKNVGMKLITGKLKSL